MRGCTSTVDMPRKFVAPLMAVCLLSGLGTIAAQNAPTPAANTLQVRSQLVVLDTVVTDRKGNVVQGLTKDDFTVYENGVKQAIKDFSSADELPPIPAEAAKDRNGNDNWGTSPLTMIVVDEMDTPFEETAYSRDCVKRFLKAKPEQLPTPTILLWLNDYGLHPLTTFTRDRDVLVTALAKQPPSLASKLARGAAAEQVAASFAALQQAALFSRGEPGKKEIIWVGRSFPSIDPIGLTDFDRTLLTKAVRSTADLLLASRVSLYVVDPTTMTSARSDDPDADDMLQPVAAGTVKDPFESSFNINLFVAETGGKYFRGRNDLDQEIASSESRGRAYYTLSYVPTSPIEPGAYRKIDVRLNRPGLIAQTKKGYYDEEGVSGANATKLDASLDEKQMRFDLYEAAVTQMQYTGLGLHVKSCKREPSKAAAVCVVQVDTGSLTFTPFNADEERTTLVGVVATLNAKGKMIYDTVARLTMAVPMSQASQIGRGFSEIQLRAVVPMGASAVRVILRDSSGRIGTATVPQNVIPSLTITPQQMMSMRRR